MAISQLPVGSRLLIGDGGNPEVFGELGKDCLKYYEPSPALKQIIADTERIKKEIHDLCHIPLSKDAGT